MSGTEATASERVKWGRVGLFYAIAFGGACLVTAGLWALNLWLGTTSAVLAQIAVALLYMPLPLVAGLLVERQAGREPLLRREWAAFRAQPWPTLGRNALIALATMLVILVVGFATAWLAGQAGVPGAGRLATTADEVRQRVAELVPGLPANAPIPEPWVLALITLFQGSIAGLTINTVFAFGEEYGWRGVLTDELAPLGRWRSNLLIGLLWGLWHAPIILLGHNYGAQWAWGIPLMVAWVTPFSFVLDWARRRTSSVLAPAMLHGCYNAMIGLFSLLILAGDVRIVLPMGLLMVLVLTVVAAATQWFTPAQSREPALTTG